MNCISTVGDTLPTEKLKKGSLPHFPSKIWVVERDACDYYNCPRCIEKNKWKLEHEKLYYCIQKNKLETLLMRYLRNNVPDVREALKELGAEEKKEEAVSQMRTTTEPCRCGGHEVVLKGIGIHDQHVPTHCLEKIMKGSEDCQIVDCNGYRKSRLIHAGEWKVLKE